MKKIIILLLLILMSVVSYADCFCYYVNSIDGLNLREKPNLNSKIIKKLPYGTKVVGWKDKPKSSLFVGNKEIKGNWTRISLQLKENGQEIYGFVFDAYLSLHLKKIPISSLYLYNRLYIRDNSKKEFEIEYRPEHNNYVWSNATCRKYFSCCAPVNDGNLRYEKNIYIPYIDNKQDSVNLRSSKLDTLKYYIKIEKVNIENIQRIKSKFEIDTMYQPKITWKDSLENLKHFYLKINHDKDSMPIKDFEGEYHVTNKYIGEIKALKKYVVEEHFEDNSAYYIDQLTGERENISIIGIPYISPNGDFQISCFYNYEMATNGYTSTLNIERKGENSTFISIDFKSWIPAKGLNNIFWVSDNEFIIKASPIDNYITSFLDNDSKELHYEYLKIKIR